jgi:hypothetical protein
MGMAPATTNCYGEGGKKCGTKVVGAERIN